MVEQVSPTQARDQSLFGTVAPMTRVSVFGPSGIEDRVIADVRNTLLELRPDLERSSVPHATALAVDGPLFLDRKGPVEVSLSIHTDLWFSRVVGIHDDSDDDDGPLQWFDNSALAARHTPRLNRFLAEVREAAAALGGAWSHDASSNRYYTDTVDDSGIRLDSAA
jgi:hypothetical protein